MKSGKSFVYKKTEDATSSLTNLWEELKIKLITL